MKLDPEDVRTRFARDWADQFCSAGGEDWEQQYRRARDMFDAWFAQVKSEALREGYSTARADMISGAFIGGPTFEALRDSFTGKRISAEAVAAERERCERIAREQRLHPEDENRLRAEQPGFVTGYYDATIDIAAAIRAES